MAEMDAGMDSTGLRAQVRASSRTSIGVRRLLIAQAVYYAATGIWSPVSLGSFERVTGPKGDGWLVKTVGVLVTVIGAVLGLAALARVSAARGGGAGGRQRQRTGGH